MSAVGSTWPTAWPTNTIWDLERCTCRFPIHDLQQLLGQDEPWWWCRGCEKPIEPA